MWMRVNFAPWPPWVIIVKEGNVTTLGGVARDIYDSFGGPLNLEYNMTLQEDLTYGSKSNGKWNGMIATMINNESDISGPYFVNEERASAVQFSVPLAFSQLSLMSGLVPSNREPLLILKIFTLQVWLLIMLSTIIASGAAAFIYVIFPSPNKRSKREAFFKYVWMFYGSILGKDLGSSDRWFLKNLLTAASFRLLLCIWLIGPALVLMYTYQGAITSTFASDKFKPKIETLDDLLQNTDTIISTFRNSYPLQCTEHLKNTTLEPIYSRIVQNLRQPETDGAPAWLDEVEDGKLVFLAEVVIMKSMIGERFKRKGRCGIYVTPIDLCSAYMSFAFQKQYKPKLQEQFNKRLLWFNEGRLYQRRLLASLANYDTCTQASSSTAKPLEISDLLGAFIVYSIGVFVSLLVFFLEKIANYKRSSRKY